MKEGLYLFKNADGACYMRIEYYEDKQMHIARHLVAVPVLPYKWTSCPVFVLEDLKGEWTPIEDEVLSSSVIS